MLPILNKEIFAQRQDVGDVSSEFLMHLPERVIQFGTGVLLRGLPDYYIDKANKAGVFNGRIVVVKTTDSGNIEDFANQDYLFTHVIRGKQDSEIIDTHFINASISRVLHATTDWQNILDCAANPEINIVLSNTTEQGIVFIDEDIFQSPPVSFPAKLLAYLHHRFTSIGHQPNSKIYVIPTELIENNGTILKNILHQLAISNHLSHAFISWLTSNVTFCNSLVDRIVPGKPGKSIMESLETELQYSDSYLFISEYFDLWAIEGQEDLASILSFTKVNPGIKIKEDISVYKELKLRLLNANHSFLAGLSLMKGFEIVNKTLQNDEMSAFESTLCNEIIASMPVSIDRQTALDYANQVVERFSNPFIEHYWSSIIFNYTDKFKIRCSPLMVSYINRNQRLPDAMMTGLIGCVQLCIPTYHENGMYIREIGQRKIVLNDPNSEDIYNYFTIHGLESTIDFVLSEYLFKDVDVNVLTLLTKATVSKIHDFEKISNP